MSHTRERIDGVGVQLQRAFAFAPAAGQFQSNQSDTVAAAACASASMSSSSTAFSAAALAFGNVSFGGRKPIAWRSNARGQRCVQAVRTRVDLIACVVLRDCAIEQFLVDLSVETGMQETPLEIGVVGRGIDRPGGASRAVCSGEMVACTPARSRRRCRSGATARRRRFARSGSPTASRRCPLARLRVI